jgi:uncharacterized membrane protein YjjB (DUF3815 family)
MENVIIQLISGMLGSLGFSLLFNVGKKFLPPAALGGFLTWGVYLLCMSFSGMGVLMSTVIASAICQIYAEILARIYKTPTTVFVIPAVVPLIPGGSLYNTMYSAVIKDWVQFRYYGAQTLWGTLGIAIGLSFVSGILYIAANHARNKACK